MLYFFASFYRSMIFHKFHLSLRTLVTVAENPETLDMRIVYRMRGLMGDATEEFVETLDKKKEENVDKEEVRLNFQ